MSSNITMKSIKKEFIENINSHIFLVETNSSQDALNDIKELLSDVMNADEITKTQIMDETYLELIIVKPEGKDIKKDQIALLQERLKNKPVLSDKMFYIISNADKLNETSSNKLLKTIEEPPENVFGFIITENIDTMLPTIKSRCEIFSLTYEINNGEQNENIDKIACSLIKYIEKKNIIEYNLLKDNDNFIKDNTKEIVRHIIKYYNKACGFKANISNNDIINFIKENNNFNTLIKKCKYLNKIDNKLTESMNNDLLLEMIFLDMEVL